VEELKENIESTKGLRKRKRKDEKTFRDFGSGFVVISIIGASLNVF